MNLHDLSPPEGSRKEKKRDGRGDAAPGGEKAGRGTKGQKKRNTVPVYFEGGQTPFYRRVPKRGFNRHQRTVVQEVNVESLNRFQDDEEIGPAELREHGLIDAQGPIKLLGKGVLEQSLIIRVHAVSSGAREKVEEAGGSVELISADRDA